MALCRVVWCALETNLIDNLHFSPKKTHQDTTI